MLKSIFMVGSSTLITAKPLILSISNSIADIKILQSYYGTDITRKYFSYFLTQCFKIYSSFTLDFLLHHQPAPKQ